MIGKWRLVEDKRKHCTWGWAGRPGCNYTGGHFCDRLAGHKGKCRCACGKTSRRNLRIVQGVD